MPFPSPGDLLDPGTEPRFPALQVDPLPSEQPKCCNISLARCQILHNRKGNVMKPQSKWKGTEILANCGLYISLSQKHMTTWNTSLTSLSKTLGRGSGLKIQSVEGSLWALVVTSLLLYSSPLYHTCNDAIYFLPGSIQMHTPSPAQQSEWKSQHLSSLQRPGHCWECFMYQYQPKNMLHCQDWA